MEKEKEKEKIFGPQRRRKQKGKRRKNMSEKEKVMMGGHTHRRNCEDRDRILDSEFTIHIWLLLTDACLVIEGHMKMVGRQVFFTERFFDTRHLHKSATSRSGFQPSHVSPVSLSLASLLFSLLSLVVYLFSDPKIQSC